MKAYNRLIPIILIGNKSDLEDQGAITSARASEISRRWGMPYYETSARNKLNVDQVFTDVYRQMIHSDRNDETLARNDKSVLRSRGTKVSKLRRMPQRSMHNDRPGGRGERQTGLTGGRMRALLRKFDGTTKFRHWSKFLQRTYESRVTGGTYFH